MLQRYICYKMSCHYNNKKAWFLPPGSGLHLVAGGEGGGAGGSEPGRPFPATATAPTATAMWKGKGKGWKVGVGREGWGLGVEGECWETWGMAPHFSSFSSRREEGGAPAIPPT